MEQKHTDKEIEKMSIQEIEAEMTLISDTRAELLSEQRRYHDILEKKEMDIALQQKLKLDKLSPAERARALQILSGDNVPKEDDAVSGITKVEQ